MGRKENGFQAFCSADEHQVVDDREQEGAAQRCGGPQHVAADRQQDADRGKRGVETRVRISVAQVNNAFRRSAVTARLVLLGTEKVSHVTSGNSTTDLVNMTFAATPGLMKIHEQRQRHRADLVTLFTGASPQNIMHGSSWMLNSTNGAPAYGFNVVEAIYAPTSVFVHEIGHNLGCSHATNDVGGFMHGAFTNSHGWKFGITTNGNTYPMRTLMSYGMGRRLGYFSNPNVSIWGVPTGDTNFANNAFTIQQMAPVVGSYFTEIIHHTQLVPNASRFQFYLAPPIAPAFGSREGFFGAPGSSYRRLPMHHKCWWVRRNSWPSEAARELLVRMPSKALMPSSSNFGLARRTMVSPDWFGM